MEVKYNNTAGRLLAILSAFKNKHSPSMKAQVLWQEVLELPDAEDGSGGPERWTIYRSLESIAEDLEQVEEDIRQLRPESTHLFLQDFNSLKHFVADAPARGSWANPCIDDSALRDLELCARELPEEGTVTQDELNQISEAVNKLFNDVKSSDIDDTLKRWILELLSAIKKSIDNYHIFGAKGLRTTFSMLIGEFTLHSEALKEVKERDATIFERLGNVFHSVHNVMMKAKQWLPLLKEGAKVLQLPFDDGGGND